MKPRLPHAGFDDLADAVFKAGQVMAIRVDTMRSLRGEGIGRGALEDRIAEDVPRVELLQDLFVLLTELGRNERESRAFLAAVLDVRRAFMSAAEVLRFYDFDVHRLGRPEPIANSAGAGYAPAGG